MSRNNNAIDHSECRKKVLDCAVRLTRSAGYQKYSRDELARESGYSTGSISRAFGGMENLRLAVAKETEVK